MGKRKRNLVEHPDTVDARGKDAKRHTTWNKKGSGDLSMTIQVICGTYEKVLHGMQATVSRKVGDLAGMVEEIEFADTFLLSSHGSAIRCLAISPPSASDVTNSQKAILASGSSDQVVNLYHISREAQVHREDTDLKFPTLAGNKITENPRNRELGSLQHHSGSINALYFPTRSKLLSAAEDNTISVARTRDWTVLSTIKAPIPKAHGRPSGDTAPLGGTPSGINDLAIHPSMKLMVSVSKGEKCMRLWNLVTGKRAGVLNFNKHLLHGVGEGRWGSGEGRRVEWNSLGEQFVVGFEKGCVVFGMDCQPKCRIVPSPNTKIHQLRYAVISTDDQETKEILAVSTEDGRIIFYRPDTAVTAELKQPEGKTEIPTCEAIGQLGGPAEGIIGRIKDFEILDLPESADLIIITGSSDGAIRLWLVEEATLQDKPPSRQKVSGTKAEVSLNGKNGAVGTASVRSSSVQGVGHLLGTYEAGNRITCLKAFVMSEPKECEIADPQRCRSPARAGLSKVVNENALNI